MRLLTGLHKLLIEDAGSFFNLLAHRLVEDSGATAIEYSLIAALIAVAAVTVFDTVGQNLSSTFSTVAGNL